MSFSKAKITRFNEITPITPSPADYNVAVKTAANGATISKSERFTEPKSPSISDNNSAPSVNSTPCFRTPTLPKKKKTIFKLSTKKTKPAADLFANSTSDLEALKDKIVECNNKDVYIKDLTEQIEDMKGQLSTLEKQKENLMREKDKYEEISNELREEQKVVLQNVYLEHDREVHELKTSISQCELNLFKANEELFLLIKKHQEKEAESTSQYTKLKSLHDKTCEELEAAIHAKNEAISNLKSHKVEMEKRMTEICKKHELEIKDLITKYKTEITDLEYNMLKSITEMQNKTDREKKAFELKIQGLQNDVEGERLKSIKLEEDANARIKQIEENYKEANLLAEIQLTEKCKDLEVTWKFKMENQEKESDAILKECQAISEYNIIQCELEKNEIKSQLDKKLLEFDELQNENSRLLNFCSELELKCLALESITEKCKDYEKLRKELADAINQKKMYEISLNKSHETIETLKKRLLDSDRDVEQLKSELETCELEKLEYQGRCNQLNEELETVNCLNSHLERQYENTVQQMDSRIQALESQLIAKVEEYKLSAQTEIDELKGLLEIKEINLHDAMEQLHEQQAVNAQAAIFITTTQTKLDALYELKCSEETDSRLNELKVQLDERITENECLRELVKNRNVEFDELLKEKSKLQEKTDSFSQYCDYYKVKAFEYEKEVEELNGINKKYIEQSGKYDKLLQEFDSVKNKNALLEKKIAEQNILIGPFREQLEAYEFEHNMLLGQKTEAEMEARQMGLKYAQLLGHQNQKQKIKHMVDLKKTNFELAEGKKELEMKVKSQNRIIEKLKKELATLTQSPRKSRLPSDGKENVNSPNRTLNNSRVESPGGPLRERN